MFEVGDRVIYDGFEFIIEMKNTKGKDGDKFRPYPLNWNKKNIDGQDLPYPNTWVHEDLIKLDHQYYRSEKINKLLDSLYS